MQFQSATEILNLEALAARIPDGACVALPADYSGCAMAAVRALMRRGVRNLHVVSVPPRNRYPSGRSAVRARSRMPCFVGTSK